MCGIRENLGTATCPKTLAGGKQRHAVCKARTGGELLHALCKAQSGGKQRHALCKARPIQQILLFMSAKPHGNTETLTKQR